MREQEPKIRDAGGALAIVGVGWPAQAADFLKRFPLTFPLLADPDQEARRAYGVRSGNLGDLMGPATWTAYAQAIPRHGVTPATDRKEAALLPGTFVIDRAGRIHLAHYARSVIDWLPVDRLLDALREAATETAER